MAEQEQPNFESEIDPIIWSERDGIRLQDLPMSSIPDSLELIKENVSHNLLWQNLSLHTDEAAVEEYCARIRQVLKDCVSLAALSVESGKLLAIAICKLMSLDEFDWTMWKILPTVSADLNKIFTIQYELVKTSKLMVSKKGITFHCFDIYLTDDLKGKNFEEVMLQQAFEAAKSLKAKTLTFSCLTPEETELAKKLDMKLSNRIEFAFYRDRYGNPIFNFPEESAICLYMKRINFVPSTTTT